MALIQYLTHIHLEVGARRVLGAECARALRSLVEAMRAAA